MLYNSDIVGIAVTAAGEVIILYIDDTSAIAVGDNFIETHARLEDIWNGQGHTIASSG